MKCVNHPEREATEQCVFCKDVLCDDCAFEINNEVYSCEKCYDKYIAKQSNSPPKKKDNSKAVFAITVIIAISIFIVGFNLSNRHSPSIPSSTTATHKYETTSSYSYKPSYTPSYSTTKSYETEDLLKEIDYYSPDTYKVGVDMPAGEYMLVQYYENRSGYMCVSSDSNGKNIIDNALFKNYHFIEVSTGEYLELTNAIAVPADKHKVPDVNTACLLEGMYRVGIDIPAGEYKATSNSSSISGYYSIYNTASADRKIEDNELFTASSYLSVKDGQYLELENCTASLVK